MQKQTYKKGLIIGKFMPPHEGHLGLIKFALKYCRSLTMAVCSRPEEPISGRLRYNWMKEIFKRDRNVEIVRVRKSLPQDKSPSRKASEIWSKYLSERFKDIDVVFSSEIYGDYLANYMGIDHKNFDLKRKQVPISATQIRQNPFKYWNYMPKEVHPYFVKKICVFGPESTGKTVLAKQLARHYKTVWAPEFARGYTAKQNNKFAYEDMEKIGRGQLQLEKSMAKKANKLLFCDTDSITTLIYSRHYFGKAPSLVKKLADKKRFDLYLFTKADLPWIADPQRDLGKRRKEFEEIFKKELIIRRIPFVAVHGSGKERLVSAIRAVDNFIKTDKNQK